VFEPFSEVKKDLEKVEKTNPASQSFARVDFHQELEAAINEQINIEYNMSYIYHAMYAYFDRDNIGLPGLAKYFKDESEDERSHAEKLMAYQNTRGGRVSLKSIMLPEMDYSNEDKGDALYAMELALSLEKLNFQKLRELVALADDHNDAQMSDYILNELLKQQVVDVKKVSEYVSQLRRVGKGLGVWQFDQELGGAVGGAADGAVA
jgi:ferritin heavy chain